MEAIEQFINNPLKRDMDALDWLLFIGFIVTIVIMWVSIVNEIISKYK